MTTLHQPREAGLAGLFGSPEPSGIARTHPGRPPLRIVVMGESLAGDVSLVAGSRARLTVVGSGRGGPPHALAATIAAITAILRADLVLISSEAHGPLVRFGHAAKSLPRSADLDPRDGAHHAALATYFATIADALTRVDRDGVFFYADRAGLAAAGHTPEAR